MSFVEFTGRARLGRRTKNLVGRLGPDDVAIIDHQDLDRVSAEELLESGVRVVVNVARLAERPLPEPGPAAAGSRRGSPDRRPGHRSSTRSATAKTHVRGAKRLPERHVSRDGRTLGAEELARALAEQRAG